MQKDPPFSAPGARASGHLPRQLRRLGFREFDTLFVSLTLSFVTLSCPFAIFEP